MTTPAAAEVWSPRRWAALGVLLTAGFMDLLDTTVVKHRLGPSARQRALGRFEACFVATATGEDPAAIAPSCRSEVRQLAAPRTHRSAVLLAGASVRARKDDFVAAIRGVLAYEVLVFLATAGLLLLLPGSSAGVADIGARRDARDARDARAAPPQPSGRGLRAGRPQAGPATARSRSTSDSSRRRCWPGPSSPRASGP